MEWRNPKRNAFGTIDVEINHPAYGWIPFTADAADRGAQFDVASLVAEVERAGPVAEYQPPARDIAAERAQMSLTFAQLLIGLVAEGWITEAQGDAWLDGQLPAQVNGLIASLPVSVRFAAKARAKRPSVILRSDGLVSALAASERKTEEELDAFFAKYAQA